MLKKGKGTRRVFHGIAHLLHYIEPSRKSRGNMSTLLCAYVGVRGMQPVYRFDSSSSIEPTADKTCQAGSERNEGDLMHGDVAVVGNDAQRAGPIIQGPRLRSVDVPIYWLLFICLPGLVAVIGWTARPSSYLAIPESSFLPGFTFDQHTHFWPFIALY